VSGLLTRTLRSLQSVASARSPSIEFGPPRLLDVMLRVRQGRSLSAAPSALFAVPSARALRGAYLRRAEPQAEVTVLTEWVLGIQAA
jgi:hypothetical protein